MTEQRSISGLPAILKKLGSMTAIRDTYMVEQSLLRTLGPLLGVFEASFYRVDDQNKIIRALHHSRNEIEENGAKRIVERVEEVNSGHEITSELFNLFDAVRLLRKSRSKKMLGGLLSCYPIFANHELQGYFVFTRDREVSSFEDAIIHGVLEVFTNYFNLLDTSQRDQLTGLLNRYSLESNLDRLWNLLATRMNSSADRSRRSINSMEKFWLGVLDVDKFKLINDTHGHVIGDEVLIMITGLLQGSFRQSDLIYRYGGEEFVVIIATKDLDDAVLAFERVRQSIEQFDFPQVGKVTISGGFSRADPTILPQEVINQADSALYAAKNAGRNRVYFYDELVEQGILKLVPAGTIDLF